MKWDSAADQHLLLAILSAHKVTVDHNRVAQIVGCTPRACEERIKKLRKLAKECGYEVQAPMPLLSGKKGRKGGKGGKDFGRKRKCIDNEDMILYRKGIVSDDIEVKREDDVRIKTEFIKREFGIFGYGHGYGCEDVKPFIKGQEMGDSSLSFAADPGIRNFYGSSVPYADTVVGLGFPLEVQSETARESLASNCRRGGGEIFDFQNHSAVSPKEFPKSSNYCNLTPRTRPPKIEYSVQSQEPAEFIEISPASRKDPLVIDDRDDNIS